MLSSLFHIIVLTFLDFVLRFSSYLVAWKFYLFYFNLKLMIIKTRLIQSMFKQVIYNTQQI